MFFFLGRKGYVQPSCLGPLVRIGESSQLATGVSAADKQRKARREEAMGEGRGRQWQRDMEVHRGSGLTFIHNIVHRWSAPGMREQKGLLCLCEP